MRAWCRIEAVDPLLMTQGCNPLGHLWQPPNTRGLKSPPALPEKDTYGFGVAHLLRDPNLIHGRVTFAASTFRR
jgi:hypothetical protein